MHSVDILHRTNQLKSTIKSKNHNLQSMEMRSHSYAIFEYQLNLLEHSLSTEFEMQPNLKIIKQQPEIKLNIRSLLLDFLMELITVLNMSKSVFPLTVNLIDRYASVRIVKKQHYQLLGLSTLWISCKSIDSKFKIPSLSDLNKFCADSYCKELFIEMEKHVLKSLEWRINHATYNLFIDLYMCILLNHNKTLKFNFDPSVSELIKKSNYFIKLLSIYICELFQFYTSIYFDYMPSQLALICLLLSILSLNIPIDLIQLINFFNELPKYIQKNSKNKDDYKHFPKQILSLSIYKNFTSKSSLKNLVTILRNPPKSLDIKYFSKESKFNQIMSSILNYSLESIFILLGQPTTPQISIAPYSFKKFPDSIVTKNKKNFLPLTPISIGTTPVSNKKIKSIDVQKESTNENSSFLVFKNAKKSQNICNQKKVVCFDKSNCNKDHFSKFKNLNRYDLNESVLSKKRLSSTIADFDELNSKKINLKNIEQSNNKIIFS